MSHFVDSDPVTEVKRSKSNFRIYFYNQHIGGVDLLDSLLARYRNNIESKKWYHRRFLHLLDMVIVNAWILWCKYMNADVHSNDFKLTISNLLANASKDPSTITRQDEPSIETNNIRNSGLKGNKPYSAIRFDRVGH